MAKLKKNYESSLWARLVRFVRFGGDALDESMSYSLSEQPRYLKRYSAEREQERERDLEDKHRADMEREHEQYERVHEWSATRGAKLIKRVYAAAAVLICAGLVYMLLQTVALLPTFGDSGNPINNEVSERYVEKGLEETGAVSAVAGMILDYRAFDTLGESHVLFAAVCGVMLLLRVKLDENGRPTREKLDAAANDNRFEPRHDEVLERCGAVLVPVVLLLGAYIILNGHISPGGGFSGGAVMGAGLILYLNAFGFKRTELMFNMRTFKTVSVCALAFYALSKGYVFFTGANGLDSHIGNGIPGAIFSAGLIPALNIAVGMVVACTMYGVYALFRKGDF